MDNNVKWVLETELYGKLQEKREDILEFVMRKLQLINLLNIGITMRDKVELITLKMLPYVQEKLESKRIDTIMELLKHINKLNSFQASLDENHRFHRGDGYHERTNRSFGNFERNGAENSNRNGNNNNNRDNIRFQNRYIVNDRTPSPQIIETEILMAILPKETKMFILRLLYKIKTLMCGM